ncbi:unnamed protein product [Calicophoron daubneyi]|uniref:PPC domain-containing protein n=1 Tax=Calicophoron daubneyi TaxID=300641 RepID=A0AAV2T0K7_CALDB
MAVNHDCQKLSPLPDEVKKLQQMNDNLFAQMQNCDSLKIDGPRPTGTAKNLCVQRTIISSTNVSPDSTGKQERVTHFCTKTDNIGPMSSRSCPTDENAEHGRATELGGTNTAMSSPTFMNPLDYSTHSRIRDLPGRVSAHVSPVMKSGSSGASYVGSFSSSSSPSPSLPDSCSALLPHNSGLSGWNSRPCTSPIYPAKEPIGMQSESNTVPDIPGEDTLPHTSVKNQIKRRGRLRKETLEHGKSLINSNEPVDNTSVDDLPKTPATTTATKKTSDGNMKTTLKRHASSTMAVTNNPRGNVSTAAYKYLTWREKDRRRRFREEWKHLWLVVPHGRYEVMCLVCHKVMTQRKLDTIKRHTVRRHVELLGMPETERQNLFEQLVRQQNLMNSGDANQTSNAGSMRKTPETGKPSALKKSEGADGIKICSEIKRTQRVGRTYNDGAEWHLNLRGPMDFSPATMDRNSMKIPGVPPFYSPSKTKQPACLNQLNHSFLGSAPNAIRNFPPDYANMMNINGNNSNPFYPTFPLPLANDQNPFTMPAYRKSLEEVLRGFSKDLSKGDIPCVGSKQAEPRRGNSSQFCAPNLTSFLPFSSVSPPGKTGNSGHVYNPCYSKPNPAVSSFAHILEQFTMPRNANSSGRKHSAQSTAFSTPSTVCDMRNNSPLAGNSSASGISEFVPNASDPKSFQGRALCSPSFIYPQKTSQSEVPSFTNTSTPAQGGPNSLPDIRNQMNSNGTIATADIAATVQSLLRFPPALWQTQIPNNYMAKVSTNPEIAPLMMATWAAAVAAMASGGTPSDGDQTNPGQSPRKNTPYTGSDPTQSNTNTNENKVNPIPLPPFPLPPPFQQNRNTNERLRKPGCTTQGSESLWTNEQLSYLASFPNSSHFESFFQKNLSTPTPPSTAANKAVHPLNWNWSYPPPPPPPHFPKQPPVSPGKLSSKPEDEIRHRETKDQKDRSDNSIKGDVESLLRNNEVIRPEEGQDHASPSQTGSLPERLTCLVCSWENRRKTNSSTDSDGGGKNLPVDLASHSCRVASSPFSPSGRTRFAADQLRSLTDTCANSWTDRIENLDTKNSTATVLKNFQPRNETTEANESSRRPLTSKFPYLRPPALLPPLQLPDPNDRSMLLYYGELLRQNLGNGVADTPPSISSSSEIQSPSQGGLGRGHQPAQWCSDPPGKAGSTPSGRENLAVTSAPSAYQISSSTANASQTPGSDSFARNMKRTLTEENRSDSPASSDIRGAASDEREKKTSERHDTGVKSSPYWSVALSGPEIDGSEGVKTAVNRDSTYGQSSTFNARMIRLAPGQDVRGCLENYVVKHKLAGAFIITCCGSVESAHLRLANLQERNFPGPLEIVSLVGTIASDGSPHLHISLADSSGHVFGGHLLGPSPVHTTAEIVLGVTGFETPTTDSSPPQELRRAFESFLTETSCSPAKIARKTDTGGDSNKEETREGSFTGIRLVRKMDQQTGFRELAFESPCDHPDARNE